MLSRQIKGSISTTRFSPAIWTLKPRQLGAADADALTAGSSELTWRSGVANLTPRSLRSSRQKGSFPRAE
jgi:hypothetical protein